MDKKEKLEELVELSNKAHEKHEDDISFEMKDDELLANIHGASMSVSKENLLDELSLEEIESAIESNREVLEQED